MTNPELPDWFANFKRLPPLPHDVHHLVKALSDDNLGIAQLARIIEKHQTVATRLIALANSAWANHSKEPVTSIEKTCLKLGLNIVRGVSIGLAVMKPFNVSQCPGFDIKRYWASSMLVAQGAAALADVLPASERDDQFVQTVRTAGILHNIGLLCLADLMPQETHRAFSLIKASPEIALNQVLRDILNTDYSEVGGFLTAHWGLPDVLVAVIKQHCELSYQGPYWKQTVLVGSAAHMVGLLFRNEDMQPLQQLEMLDVSQERQQQLFIDLQVQFPKILELAKVLFR
jgi:HD-like signal output (HDOD) protein